MTLTEDIIVRYKELTFRFKKGSIIKKEGKFTYILPIGQRKPIEINGKEAIVKEVIAEK